MLSFNWLLVIGAYMLVGWAATHVAHKVESRPRNISPGSPSSRPSSAVCPLLLIAALKAPASSKAPSASRCSARWVSPPPLHITRKDFSFLRGMLVWGGILALVAIVGAVLFGFELGTWFSVAMIGFAGAAAVYLYEHLEHSSITIPEGQVSSAPRWRVLPRTRVHVLVRARGC
jgi:hypothetical protein